jgi:hypothetical protein
MIDQTLVATIAFVGIYQLGALHHGHEKMPMT